MEPRNYLANAGANPPAAPAAPSVGYPQAAVPGVSQATTPGPYWFYKIGEELRALITAGGVTPSDADLAQVLAGLRRLHQWGDGIYAGDTGAADAYVVALTPAVTVAHDMRFRALIANTNTGASTIDFGIGAKQIVGRAAVALEGGEMPAGAVATFDYDSGADIVTLVDCTEGPQQVSDAIKSNHAVAYGQVFGLGQTWQDMTAYRALGTTYTNSTGKMIKVTVSATTSNANVAMYITTDGFTTYGTTAATSGTKASHQREIEPGSSYLAQLSTGGGSSLSWLELRA